MTIGQTITYTLELIHFWFVSLDDIKSIKQSGCEHLSPTAAVQFSRLTL